MDERKERKVVPALLLVVLLAFAFRAFPYLNGYNFLIDDGYRELEKVRFIEGNGGIEMGAYYGSFPVIHLLVFFSSRLSGFSSWDLMHFLPQLVSSFSVLVFFLFMRRHFPEKTALFGVFFLSFFGPMVWWASLGVRESMGFLFLSLYFLFFDRAMGKGSGKNLFLFLVSMAALIFSHHWSSFIATGSGFFLMFFLHPSKRKAVFFFSLALLFAQILYWASTVGYILRLVSFFFSDALFLALAVLFLLLVFFCFKKIVLFVERTVHFLSFSLKRTLLAFALSSLVVLFVAIQFEPFSHPLQFFFSPLFLAFFSFAGLHFFPGKKRNLLLGSIFSVFFLLLVLFSGFLLALVKEEFVFDSFRAVEFLVFPCAFLAASGFSSLARKLGSVSFGFVVFFVSVSGLLVFPSSFLFGENFYGTVFYDARSDVKFVSPETVRAMQWGNEHTVRVLSLSWNGNELHRISLKEADSLMYLLVEPRDYRLLEGRELFKSRVFALYAPELLFEGIEGKPLYYSSDGVKGFLIRK